MYIVNVIIPIIYIVLMFLPLLFNKWTSKTFSIRGFNITIGILLLLCFFGLRYIWYIFDFIQFTQYNEVPKNLLLSQSDISISKDNYLLIQSIIYSNIMLLNVGDLLSFLLPVAMICFSNKSFTKVISILFLCSVPLLDIFNYSSKDWQSINYGYLSNIPFWKYLFVSNGITKFPIVINILNLLCASSLLISTREFSRWSIISSLIFLSAIIVYIILMTDNFDILVNTSGYSILDWSKFTITDIYIVYSGPYNPINWLSEETIWKNVNMIRLITTAMMFFIIIILFLFKNLFTSSLIKTNFIFDPWYKNIKIFRSVFYYIDGTINNLLWKLIRNNYLSGSYKLNLFNQIKILFNKKLRDEIIANNANKNNYLSLALNHIKNEQINNEILFKYNNNNKIKKSHQDKEKKNKKHKDEQNTKTSIKTTNVVKCEPYLEDGIWWYIDEFGNKYFAKDNQWILFV